MIYTIIICLLAGLGAGVSTGFAGLSAAVFISPMLIGFLHMPAFDAIGVALASDVLASALSAHTYHKSGNIDLPSAKPLMISIFICAVVGTVAGYFFTSFSSGETLMSRWMIVASLLLGFKFLIKPSDGSVKKHKNSFFWKAEVPILSGIYIGFVCGFQGTGGGMMMLFVLTSLMQFEFKKAVGTSVFIMTFTAAIGALSHFAMNGVPDLTVLALCIVFTTVGARIAAVIANNYLNAKALSRITGALLTISCLIIVLFSQMP